MISKNRFSDADWYKDIDYPEVTVIGAGGIGSWLTLYLSRISNNEITVFDNDVVDEYNLAGQFFSYRDISLNKVESLRYNVKKFSYINIRTSCSLFTTETYFTLKPKIMFLAVDSMSVRKEIFYVWLEEARAKNFNEFLLIDGRMSAERGQIYVVHNEKTANYYIENLFEDSDIPDEPCTFKATTHCANYIASQMTSCFLNWICIQNNKQGRRLYTSHIFDLATFYFKQEFL